MGFLLRWHQAELKVCLFLRLASRSRTEFEINIQQPQKIYVTPDQYFITKFREIFQKTTLQHNTEKESKTWLAGPNMRYWRQQLNFAVWCTTTACGISREIFDKDRITGLTPNVQYLYKFHIYFTLTRILFQMGWKQSISASSGVQTFSQVNNKYEMASYKRIYAKFGIDPLCDFRFTREANHSLVRHLSL